MDNNVAFASDQPAGASQGGSTVVHRWKTTTGSRIERPDQAEPSRTPAGESGSEATSESLVELLAVAVAALDADPERARCVLLRLTGLLKVNPDLRPPRARPPAQGVVRGGLATWQLKKVLHYIEGNLEQPISGQGLADLIGVSRGQLFRGFKASVGMQPLQYVAVMRVRLAQRMMCDTAEPLSQIALACGLCDQSHFCRTFNRVVGQTPNRWRRENAPESVHRSARGNSSHAPR